MILHSNIEFVSYNFKKYLQDILIVMQFKCENILLENNNKILVLLGVNGKKINKINFDLLTKSYDKIIINGNLGKDLILIKNILNKNIKYVFSHEDYFFIKNNYLKLIKENWLKNIPNIIKLEFKNQTNVIICNAGLNKNEQLENNYLATFNNGEWIKKYNGSYGWVISNIPLMPEIGHTTNFTVQNFINYSEGRAWGQEVSSKGLEKKIFFTF